MVNKTFRGGENLDFRLSACVGENGNPDYYTYAKGYSGVSNLLLNAFVVDKLDSDLVDTFVYPVCFNMRHSVELRLKGAISLIKGFPQDRVKLSPFDLEGSHDIGLIWKYIKEEITKYDSRIKAYVRSLDEYISDIAEVDSTGQVFRYPYTKCDEKHLAKVGTINIGVLRYRFGALELLLDSFDKFLIDLKEEYKLGTYTKNLSRYDILNIANELPNPKDWVHEDFKLLKEKLKKTYDIGSRELSCAIDIIKGLYRTKISLIPVPPLKYLSVEDIKHFFVLTMPLHQMNNKLDDKTPDVLDFGNREAFYERIRKAIEMQQITNEIAKKLIETLSVDKLIDIMSLYDSSKGFYPEKYLQYIEHHKIETKGYGSDHWIERICSMLKKYQLNECILKGLYLIGHYRTAEKVITDLEIRNVYGLIYEKMHLSYVEPFEKTTLKFINDYNEYIKNPCNIEVKSSEKENIDDV